MSSKNYTLVTASQLEGFQHGHDSYWYRPIVFGRNLMTHLAYVPPGGSMPPHGHGEGKGHELSFLMLEGKLEVSLDGAIVPVTPGDAIHILPEASFGVFNRGAKTAVFVMTFNPAPQNASIEGMRTRFQARGAGMKPAAEMNDFVK
jgi:quercetin dioxygenase-like cupin family protein